MENLFVKILNSTLLVVALLCLLTACVVLLVVGFSYGRSLAADTSSHPVSIAYESSNVVSAEGSGSLGGALSTQNQNTGALQNADPQTMNAAKASCDSLYALVEFISKNQFEWQDRADCSKNLVNSATSLYGDRAANYISERSKYLRATLTDPQARALFYIAPGSDVNRETVKYAKQIISQFKEKFDVAVAQDEARKEREAVASFAAKARAITLISVAGIAFVAFLVIAFLLVAVRLERHVGKIESKIAV